MLRWRRRACCLRLVRRHVVHLDEDVLSLRVGVVRRLMQRQIDVSVPVAVDPVRLPRIRKRVTVGVLRLRRPCEVGFDRKVAGEKRGG